jgi:AcrR family transcriptional regulator
MSETLASGPGMHFTGSIAESAFELMVESGYSAMSMRSLAKKLGMQPGSIYHHFHSKVDVLEQVIEALLNRRLAGWLRVKPKRADVASSMRSFIAFHVKYQLKFGRNDQLLMMEVRHLDQVRRKKILGSDTEYFDELRKIVSQGAQSNAFKVPDVDIVAASLLALLNGAPGLLKDEKPMSEAFIVQLMTHMTWRLLGAQPTKH